MSTVREWSTETLIADHRYCTIQYNTVQYSTGAVKHTRFSRKQVKRNAAHGPWVQ